VAGGDKDSVARRSGAAADLLEFRILGPVEAARSGRSLPLGGPKQRALLALLLVHRDRVVPSDRLIEELWSGAPPPGARTTLRSHVSRLRALLGDGDAVVHSRPPGYVLVLTPEQLDSARFERLAREGREALGRGAADIAADTLRAALALWRGPALADVAEEPFARLEAARLEELRLSTLEDGIEAELALGRHAELVPTLESLVTEHPLRERLWGYLMLALYRCDRQAEALEAYRRLRARLVDDLGLEPSETLQDIQLAILRRELPSALGREPAHNLPAQLTSFVGRARELSELGALLAGARLVTLTGIGGSGKTRLALEAASRALPGYRDGVWLVDLAALGDPALVPHRVAATLGVQERTARAASEVVADHVRTRELLLVLDNCEHVVEACARLAAELLGGAPGLRVVATSRRPLGVRGEVTYAVPPLAAPEKELSTTEPLDRYESVRLFLDRASAARPRLRMPRRTLATVARICRELDGLPLAIELAAGRVDVMTVEEIATYLGERFAVLRSSGGMPTGRHQTLEATLDWSYELLGAEEQLILRRLGVFAGGFTLTAVAEVCVEHDRARALEVLTRLVEASLVLAEEREGRMRYRLLETVRQYAVGRLRSSGEDERVRDRHARYFLALAEEAEPQLAGDKQAAWLDRLEEEHDNLRAALASSGRRQDETGLRLARALFEFWYLHGHYDEGREWLGRAIAAAGDTGGSDRAEALQAAGTLAFLQCDYARATELLDESLTLSRQLGGARGIASSLQVLGSVARERGAYEKAVALHAESLALWRELGDQQGIARSINYLAFVAWVSGEHDKAEMLCGQVLPLVRKLGDKEGIAWSLLNLGAACVHRDEHARANVLCAEALEVSGEIGYKEGIAWAFNLLGIVADREGDHARASRCLTESLAGHAELGDRWRAASVLEALAGLAAARDDHVRSARLFGAAEALREAIGAPVPACERVGRERHVAEVRAALDADGCARAWAEGRTMTLEEAGAEALRGSGRGLATAALGPRRAIAPPAAAGEARSPAPTRST
jgi:predicted ATPase/DNA-binding SARP family transcriptional activator